MLQARVRELVVAPQQFEVLFEPFLRACVAERSPQKVCRALPDGQIQALDERGVQCRGVLGATRLRAALSVRP